MILSLLAVLDGGKVEPETRLEIPFPKDFEKVYIEVRVDASDALTLRALPDPILFDGGDLILAFKQARRE